MIRFRAQKATVMIYSLNSGVDDANGHVAAVLEKSYAVEEVRCFKAPDTDDAQGAAGDRVHVFALLSAQAVRESVKNGQRPHDQQYKILDDKYPKTAPVGAWVCHEGCDPPEKNEQGEFGKRSLPSSVQVRNGRVDQSSVKSIVEEFAEAVDLRRKLNWIRWVTLVTIVTFLASIITIVDVSRSRLIELTALPTPPPTVIARVNYVKGNDVYDEYENRKPVPLTAGKLDPLINDEIRLGTDKPLDGWVAYGIMQGPNGFYFTRQFTDESYGMEFPMTPETAGPMTVMIVLLPDDHDRDAWKRVVNRHFDAAEKAGVQSAQSNFEALPENIRLRWFENSYIEVDANTGLGRGEAPDAVSRAPYHKWAGRFKECMDDFGQPFVWSGQSFMIRDPSELRGGSEAGGLSASDNGGTE